MLAILFVWRHVYRRFPLTYDPLYSGAVFPLGMYTVCTLQVADEMAFGFLDFIPATFIYIALMAWLLALLGLGRRMVSILWLGLPPPSARQVCRSGG